MYNVIQWATGLAGTESLRAILDHGELDLAGVWCWSSAKAGKDAGELCGRPPTGVIGTQDIDHLLSLDADCVCYTATDTNRREEVIDEFCRILEAGLNVVSPYMPLVYPPSVPEHAARIEAACQAGGSSFFAGGIDPGFMLDLVPAIMASCSRQVEWIGASEILDISAYDDAFVMRAIGLGVHPDEFDIEQFKEFWDPFVGATPRMLAHLLGLPVDKVDIQVFHESVVSGQLIDLAKCRVEPGTIGGLRTGFIGMYEGVERFRCSWILRLAPHIQPEWWPPEHDGDYRIDIKGLPSIRLNMAFDRSDNALLDAFGVTANRIVNAIPAVCKAPPGLHMADTLPQILGNMT